MEDERPSDELEELDEEPELSELKVVETEFVEAGATASGATSGGLSAYFRRNDLCTSVTSAVRAESPNQLFQEIQALSFVVDLKPCDVCCRSLPRCRTLDGDDVLLQSNNPNSAPSRLGRRSNNPNSSPSGLWCPCSRF